jgi:hypothetical protein
MTIKNLSNIQINLLHILFVGPLFIYMWFYQSYLKLKLSDSFMLGLLLLGTLIILYHLFIIYKKTK